MPKEDEQERDEIVQDLFSAEDRSVAESEEPEKPDADEAGAEEDEKGEEPEESDADSEDKGDGIAASEAKSQDDLDEEPETESAGGKAVPKRVLRELQKSRSKIHDLRKQLTELRGHAPTPGQVPGYGPPQPQAPQPERIPIRVDEDGNQYVDPADYEAYQARQQQARTPQPTIDEVARTRFAQGRDGFVAGNPPARAAVAQRVDDAAQMLDLLSQRVVMEMGGIPPANETLFFQAFEASGALGEFREHFPEISDVRRFAHAAFGGDSRVTQWWLEDYERQMATSGESDSEEDSQAMVPSKRPQKAASSNVRALPKGRPRTMAKKGASGADGEDNEARHARLLEEANADPLGLAPDASERNAELERLEKKLGFV